MKDEILLDKAYSLVYEFDMTKVLDADRKRKVKEQFCKCKVSTFKDRIVCIDKELRIDIVPKRLMINVQTKELLYETVEKINVIFNCDLNNLNKKDIIEVKYKIINKELKAEDVAKFIYKNIESEITDDKLLISTTYLTVPKENWIFRYTLNLIPNGLEISIFRIGEAYILNESVEVIEENLEKLFLKFKGIFSDEE